MLAGFLAMSSITAIRLYGLARNTLRGKRKLSAKESWKYPGLYLMTIIAPGCVAAFIFLSYAAINGTPQTHIARFMSWLGYPPFADLSNADISIKPPNWTGKKDDELDSVKGANLAGLDLRYMNARGAFLAKTNLSGAYLQGSDFSRTDLRRAFLPEAHLDSANLKSCNLREAYLVGTDLKGTQLAGADLTGAFLQDADLTDAKLMGSVIFGYGVEAITDQRATATVEYARLYHTKGLTPFQIKDLAFWHKAFYDPDTLLQLGLPIGHDGALQAYRASGSNETFDSWEFKWLENRTKTVNKPKSK